MVAKDAFFLGDRRGGTTRWLRVVSFIGLVLAALFLFWLVFLRLTRIAPPLISEALRAAPELPVAVAGARAYVGASWMSRERGVWELHLEGRANLRHGLLAVAPRLTPLARSRTTCSARWRACPSKIAFFLICAGVRLRYRHLPERARSRADEDRPVSAARHDRRRRRFCCCSPWCSTTRCTTSRRGWSTRPCSAARRSPPRAPPPATAI